MNTQSNTLPESFEAQTIASPALTAVRSMYWSIRRELWESRSIYIAPSAAAVVFLLGFLISMVRLPQKMRALSALDPAHQREAIAMPYDMVAGLLMLTAMIVGMFYCLGALQGERRDRSILFWKSLPVSDLTTVLSKASIPFVVLPLLTFAITVATQWIMLLLSTVVLWANGLNATTLWTRLSFFQMSLYLLYHLVTVHALWQAPIYGWLLLTSAWARRAAFLWAALPLLAIGAVERLVFNTRDFAAVLENRLTGGGAEALTMPGTFPMNPMTYLTPGTYLSSSGLWIGPVFTALCLAAAVRLRRYRGPI
jgi:ABC-2 type transport system permease protein